jgi:hypothetical protein
MPHRFARFGLLHKLWGGPPGPRPTPPGRLRCLSQVIDPSIEERDESVPRRSRDLPNRFPAVSEFAKTYVALAFRLSAIPGGVDLLACPRCEASVGVVSCRISAACRDGGSFHAAHVWQTLEALAKFGRMPIGQVTAPAPPMETLDLQRWRGFRLRVPNFARTSIVCRWLTAEQISGTGWSSSSCLSACIDHARSREPEAVHFS